MPRMIAVSAGLGLMPSEPSYAMLWAWRWAWRYAWHVGRGEGRGGGLSGERFGWEIKIRSIGGREELLYGERGGIGEEVNVSHQGGHMATPFCVCLRKGPIGDFWE